MHDYTQPEIWDLVWKRPYSRYEKHHQIFWNEIRNRVSGRVADLGCGSASCWRIPHPLAIIDLVGFDFSLAAIQEAKKNCPWGYFRVADLTSIPVGWQLYDYTVLSGIVNYYKNLKPILEEALRITKLNGHIIVTINVIDDFPNRHWDLDRIETEFLPYGIVKPRFYPKIGWLVEIAKTW